MALSSSDPEQMGAFMVGAESSSNVEHGQPDGGGGSCPLLEVGGRKGVSVRHVRRAARAFADLAQWGQSVRLGLKRPPRSAIDTQRLLPGFLAGESVTDRQRIAEYLSMLNRQTGVRPLVTREKRLSVTYSAGGLLGVLAVLPTREIAARDDLSYNCSVCGALVARGRPPQPDEAIYGTKESCKCEQRRRNQAAWRARKRAEGKS